MFRNINFKRKTFPQVSLSLFAFFLPVSQKFSAILIIIVLILSLLNFKKKNLFLNKAFLYPFFVYFLYVFSIFYSSSFDLGFIEQKASLVAFPLIFILNKQDRKSISNLLKFFVIGCVFSLLLAEINALVYYFNFNNFSSDLSLSFYQSLKEDKNFFTSYNFSNIHQTVYFGMYLTFSLVIVLYSKKLLPNKFRSFLIIFFLIGIFQTLNKASLIVLVFVMIFYVNKMINNKKTTITLISTLIFAGGLLFILNPRFDNFKNSIKNTFDNEIVETNFQEIKNNNPNRGNFRLMLWSSAFELIKENPFLGIGAGGSDKRLYEVFSVKRQWYDKSEKYHAHNQYLQILLDLGLLGFIPFSLMVYYMFSSSMTTQFKTNRYIFLNAVLILALNFLFESMFERYSGISFFCFLYCLIASSKSFKKSKQNI